MHIKKFFCHYRKTLHTDALQHQLKVSIPQTLKELQSTMKAQNQHISELEEEREVLHSHNQDLEEKAAESEVKLRKLTSAKDTLQLKGTQLSEQLEGE